MWSLKGLVLPIIISVFFLFTFAYGLITKFETVMEVFSINLLDTTDISSVQQSGDVSQMFNERGFYKSNSYSFDENEIINDFNGNLMYEIPMYNFKGAGNLDLDVKLVYNGSVNHQIILSTREKYDDALFPARKYNVGAPEWIISVNGFGVQVLNFETYILTDPGSAAGDLADNNVKKLIPGYHVDESLKEDISNDNDRIYLFRGDGSTLTLINQTQNSFTGTYISDNKESHIKANVNFYEDGNDNGYRNRIVELMMGNGHIYTFKEYKRDFNDISLTNGSTVSRLRPQYMLLEEIRDLFGHKIIFYYVNQSFNSKGRPLLTNIGANETIDFDYLNFFVYGMAIDIKNHTIGNYRLRFNEYISYDGPGYKIASLKDIRNPAFQVAEIAYDNNYSRTFRYLQHNPITGDYKTVLLGNMNRIKSFKNFLGGKKEYKYFGDNQITINYVNSLINHHTLMSEGGNFQGYGRDAFYTNMVDTVAVYDSDGIQKSKYDYDYSYTDYGTGFKDKNLDTLDSYTTTKEVISTDGTTINNSNNIKSLKNYRVYSVKTYGTYNPEQLDLTGITKLMSDYTYNSSNQIFEKTGYIYHVGSLSGTGNEQHFNGSFLLLTKKDTVDSKVREWNYMYKYKDDNNDNVITQKTEVDPNGYKTQTYYNNYDIVLNFYRGWAMYGTATNSFPYSDTISILGAKTFYKIGVDTLIRRFNNDESRYSDPQYTGYNDELLKQKRFVYIEDSVSSDGYFGELRAVKEFEQGSTSKFIQTKYQYYKKDTSGRYLYGTAGFPYIEGNLKLTIKPDGQEEKYFYFPVVKIDTVGDYDSPVGTPPPPKIYFKKKYNNGTETVLWETLIDERLPIKIDNYKRINSSSVDTVKRVYMAYNAMGKPSLLINENGYLTEFNYELAYNRIKKITLPGDFSTLADRDTMYIETHSYHDITQINAIGIGFFDSIYTEPKASYGKTNSTGCLQSFLFRYDMLPSSTDKFYPYIKFNTFYLDNYSSVDSAILYIAPQWYTLRSGNQTYQEGYKFTIKPVSKCSTTTTSNCMYYDYYPVIVNTSVDAPFSDSLYRDYLNDIGRDCEPYHPYNINVGSLLNSLININENLNGFIVDYRITDTELMESNIIEVRMQLTDCNDFDTLAWLNNYKPRLTVYGVIHDDDTIRTKIYSGGTYMYYYDDVNKTVTVRSRFVHSASGNEFKKVKYSLDGFGNIKQKDIYKSSSAYNSYLYEFNFLNKPARNIDGTSDSTLFSYDFIGRPINTQNADESESNIAYTYQSSIQTAFYNITSNGFFEKQSYTDETGRAFNKYFDAVGNLLREEKFVAGDGSGGVQEGDNPFDPDTTYEGQDNPAGMTSLNTDYKYDNLYRLIEVLTPQGKHINYYYDGYGRQSQRVTPDAGQTRYSYDSSSNLVLSQDANQRAIDSRLSTRRTYDALNRLLTISDVRYGDNQGGGDGPMGDTLLPFDLDNPTAPADSTYIINVYDTISNTSYGSVFTQLPQGYNAKNFTTGRLCATAFRTFLGEAWSYKFYRYDERGNVIKFWVKLAGMDSMKTMEYKYNSQNQAAFLYYQPNRGDWKYYNWRYDDAGRLNSAGLLKYQGMEYSSGDTGPGEPDEEEVEDGPGGTWQFYHYAFYTYNPDQQVDTIRLNYGGRKLKHRYNKRNWLENLYITGGNPEFAYNLYYNPNGNIRKAGYSGSYSNNFSVPPSLSYAYTYDNSNRLVKADRDSGQSSSSFDLIMNYDKDGNFKSMKRYGSSNNLADNFTYSYYSGTNKVQKVTGSVNQFTYDANGNVKSDSVKKNYYIKYDWRNLIVELGSYKPVTDPFSFHNYINAYKTYYWYDEAGNRICKKVFQWEPVNQGQLDSVQQIIEEGDSPTGQWITYETWYYVRDISGKEIAVYGGNLIYQWNLYGLDNVGNMKANGNKLFYLKDHLGTIRAVMDTNNTVVAAYDYDPWGYPLENRTYESGGSVGSKYKFTAKERDKESSADGIGYDYFGARYYDSRIANWTSVDPLFEKHFDFTPYNYVLRNPIFYIDPNGKQIQFVIAFEAAVEMAAIATTVYATYKLSEQLVEAYEQYQSTPLQADLTQEKVEITQDAKVTTTTVQSKEQGIESHLTNIQKHLNKWDKTFSSPNTPDPHKWKDKWTTTIKTALKNIAKKVRQLNRESYEELLHKFKKWNKEDITKLTERIKEKGIDPSEFIK